jgi:large subunit ribosomal protein L1
VGKENSSDENIAKNAMAVYSAIKAVLPRGDQQMKRIMLKTTMGKPLVVGA